MSKPPPSTQARLQSEDRSSKKEQLRLYLGNASPATGLRYEHTSTYYTTKKDPHNQMIPSFMIHAYSREASTQTTGTRQQQTSVNNTAVAQTVWIMLVQKCTSAHVCALAASFSRNEAGFASSLCSGLHQHLGINTVLVGGGWGHRR